MPTERPRFRACGRSLRSKFAKSLQLNSCLLHIQSEDVTDYVSYTESSVFRLFGAVLLLGPCRRELRTVARTSALADLDPSPWYYY